MLRKACCLLLVVFAGLVAAEPRLLSRSPSIRQWTALPVVKPKTSRPCKSFPQWSRPTSRSSGRTRKWARFRRTITTTWAAPVSRATCAMSISSTTASAGVGGFTSRMVHRIPGPSHTEFIPVGFAQMAVIDAKAFDRAHYDFKFVRREFLGEVRCLVFDVSPKPKTGNGRFIGRIWVEDQDYNIVRVNGTYSGNNFQRPLSAL